MALNRRYIEADVKTAPTAESSPDTKGTSLTPTEVVNAETMTSVDSRTVDLESTTGLMMRKLDEAVRAERNYIFRHAGTPESPSPYLKGLHSIPLAPFNIPEITIGFLSGISGGKSSFLNIGVCKYPISPVANTETSTCAVETRRASSRDKERIEVCPLAEDGKSLEKTPIRVFSKQTFSETLFRQLCEYADYLVENDVLCVSDTLSYFQDENGCVLLSRYDWRNCMLLLMIVLDAYIHQDKQGDAEQKERYRKANEMRNALLKELSVPLNCDYGLRLYWDSDQIPEYTVLVDLPGTGGTTVTQEEYTSHTDLVDHYLSQLSSLICFFDERGQIDSESRKTLAAFIKANEGKGSSSARVIFVLNKADIIDRDEPNPERKIRTTINDFRASFPDGALYPVYALSTFDGELALLDSGIPLRNLHHAVYFANGARKYGGSVTQEQIMNNQNARYQRAYPCQMADGSAFSSCHFAQFTNSLITEHINRIHFLLAIERFREHMATVETIADTICAQENLLHIAQDYAPKLAEILVKSIHEAMNATIDDLNGRFSDLNKEMTRNLQESSNEMQRIAKRFTDNYRVLSEGINSKIQNKVNSLQKQKNGTIPITYNIIGGNETGYKNRQSLRELGGAISEIDFVSYFDGGFRMLNQEFAKERTLYQHSIGGLCEELKKFPDQVIRAMGTAFHKALEEAGLSGISSYQGALDIAQNTAKKLLTTVCNGYIDRLKTDKAVEQTLINTADRVRGDLLDILSPYTDSGFIDSVIRRIEKSKFFAANVIDESKLRDLLTTCYISDFQKKMEETLLEDVWGKYSTERSHVQRMQMALRRIEESHLSAKATEALQTQVENSCSITDTTINNPENLSSWKQSLDSAAKEAQDFISHGKTMYFSDESAYTFFHTHYTPFRDESWAADPLRVADEKSSKACDRVKETLPDVET